MEHVYDTESEYDSNVKVLAASPSLVDSNFNLISGKLQLKINYSVPLNGNSPEDNRFNRVYITQE